MSRCWSKLQMLILFDFCGPATPRARQQKMAVVWRHCIYSSISLTALNLENQKLELDTNANSKSYRHADNKYDPVYLNQCKM